MPFLLGEVNIQGLLDLLGLGDQIRRFLSYFFFRAGKDIGWFEYLLHQLPYLMVYRPEILSSFLGANPRIYIGLLDGVGIPYFLFVVPALNINVSKLVA